MKPPQQETPSRFVPSGLEVNFRRSSAFLRSPEERAEPHDFLSADRLLKDTHVELPGSGDSADGDSADGRKVVIAEWGPEYWRFPARSIRSYRRGKLVELGFVNEHHGPFLCLGFF